MANPHDISAQELEREAWALPPAWTRVTGAIIGAALEVHSALGPGLLERLYEVALAHELQPRGLRIERQRSLRLSYKGIALSPITLDLAVEGLVVVELKCVEVVHPSHLAQLVSYLRAADLPVGLLLNFHEPHLKNGLYRRINQEAYAKHGFDFSATSPRNSASSKTPRSNPR